MTNTAYRFRLYTAESVGAYTCVHAATQADALAELQQQLARWESAAPLHGPSRSAQWFDS